MGKKAIIFISFNKMIQFEYRQKLWNTLRIMKNNYF